MILALLFASSLQLSHFSTAVICAFCASIVFGITQRNLTENNSGGAMFRYGVYCFAYFVGGLFLAGWFMWLIHH